jgi:PIN domain nuclease of toxin-antitoxin system
VNLLLDRHAFLWFVNADSKLSKTAKALIEDPANRKSVSIATCWEIAIKSGLGKLTLGEKAATFLPRELATNHFDLLDISLGHAIFVESLPHFHRDPFDRLLIAQSIVESISIVSNEVQFDAYGVTRLW